MLNLSRYKKFWAVIIITFLGFFSIASVSEAHNQKIYFLSSPPSPFTKALTEMTPQLARKVFNIQWIDNGEFNGYHLSQIEYQIKNVKQICGGFDVPFSFNNPAQYLEPLVVKLQSQIYIPNIYPAVTIAYINGNVGYGLFAMENIKAGDILGEYTGTIGIRDVGGREGSNYSLTLTYDGKYFVDSAIAGNAMRFINSFPHEVDLLKLRLNIGSIPTSHPLNGDIATANASVFFMVCNAESGVPNYSKHTCEKLGSSDRPPRSIIVATSDISMYEQIGFCYHDDFINTPYYPTSYGFFTRSNGLLTYDELKKRLLLF